MFIELKDLDHCQSIVAGWMICPANRALLRRGAARTCASVAFFQDRPEDGEDLCEEKFVPSFPPVIVQDQARWIYSVDHPIEGIVSCGDDAILKPRETLVGVGVVELAAGCHLAAPDFYIPAASTNVDAKTVNVIPKPQWQGVTDTEDAVLLHKLVEEPLVKQPGAAQSSALTDSVLRERAWFKALINRSAIQPAAEHHETMQWNIHLLWLCIGLLVVGATLLFSCTKYNLIFRLIQGRKGPPWSEWDFRQLI